MQTEHTSKEPGRGRRLDAAVQDYLDRYAKALADGDGKAIAAMWETPALVVDDRGVIAVAKADEVDRFFSGAREQYNERGIVATRAEIQRLEWATDRIAQVDVRWSMLDESGRERGHEDTTYTLRKDDGGALRVRVAVMRGTGES
jgi:ketosteroid isomerase-like protein